jgi:3-oxoacyl-[acyl-carrier protein] reductase
MAMQTELRGRTALVTGGSRGIGLAIACRLVAEGVNVVVTGRNPSHLSAAASTIGRNGPGSVETICADVRSYPEIEKAVAAAAARFGGLDIVVNNAGVGIFANVANLSPAQWAEMIDTNLTGVFNVCHAALPELHKRGGGAIINISSLAGKNAFSGGAAYCATKAGLNAFSEALMQEVRYDNIRVSYVMPGSVATGFSGSEPSAGSDWKIAPEDVAEVVLDLLKHNPRSLPSRVELRPSKPRK